MALTGLWNWTIERLAYRPLRGSFRLAPLISAIGMSIFLSNFVQVVQGPRNKPAPQLPNHVFNLTGGAYDVTLSVRQILIMIVTVVLLAGFWFLVQHTSLGRAQRACEQDRKMAALLGIDVDATISITFVIGAALAAVAGVMFVIYYGVVNFADGFVPGVKAFTAAVLGGIGSLPGRGSRRPPDRPDRSVLVVLFHHRLQGRGGVHDSRHHPDLHAVRHPWPARSGEGLNMTAAPQTTPLATASESTASQLVPALRTAIAAALVAFVLSFPIISYHAESNIENELVLIGRWPLSFGIAALVFVFVFLRQMAGPDWRIWFDRFGTAAAGGMGGALVQAAREGEGTAPPSAARQAFGRWFGPFMLGLVIVFPLITLGLLGPAGSLKWINNYGVQIMIYVMLGWGLNIVVGLAGLLDLGYVAFYAVGAYSYALLSTTFGLSFWICLPLAGLLAAMWGIILGFPVLRLRGDYLAIVTLAFGEIIRIVLINWVDLTNGYAGITSIPHVSFFGIPFNDDDNGFAAIFHIPYSPIYRTIFLFYLILALALLTNFVTLRLRRLPIGRAWEALREDEIACRSLGINTTNTKLTAFALGAMFGGFAGSFFAVRQGFVSPESFTFIESATILAIVVLGGMGSQLGVAIAAAVMIGVPELMRELDWLKAIFGQDFDPTQYRMLLFGAAMVIMMIWKPRGLVSTRMPSVFLKERRAVAGDLVKEGHG